MTCQISSAPCVDSRMSTRRTRSPLLLSTSAALAVGTLAMPSVATAQSCQGAPGASAIQQYCEAVPRGDGGRDSSSGGSGGSGGGSGSGSGGSQGVSAATSKALAQAGKDGAAVQRLASGGSGEAKKRSSKRPGGSGGDESGTSTTGSGTSTGGSGSGAAGSGTGAAAGPKDPSGSPLNAAKNAASSGPTAGPAVAWSIVGLSVFGALAAVGLRRQRGTLPPVDEQTDDAGQG